MDKPKPNSATKGSIPAAPQVRIPADMRALYGGRSEKIPGANPRAGCNPNQMHSGHKSK